MSPEPSDPNINLMSNIWLNPTMPLDTPVGFALPHIPGDLMVEFLGTRDTRVIESQLTRRQRQQFLFCRHFAFYGMEGLAYEPTFDMEDRR